MAEIQSNIKVNLDTSGALNSLKNLQSQISTFHTQMAKSGAAASAAASNLSNNLVNSINATGKFSASIQNIKTTTESFTTSLEKNKLSMGEYFRYSIASTKSFGKVFKTEYDTINKVARERVKDLQTQYIKLGRDANGAMKAIAVRPLALDMENLATKTQIAAQRQQLLNQLLKQGSTNLLNFGKNTQWAGRQLMVGFSVPMSMAGAAAVKAYMDLEKASVAFRRVYGDANTTSKELASMTNQVQGLAASFTKYGVAVSDTMAMSARAAAMGKTGADLLAQINNATKLSVLGGVDQNTALDTTISLTNAFAISADNLSSKINFLNAVENQTVLSIDDMTTAIPKAAPVVKQLGGNVEDLAYFLTAMKEGGVNASEGANALKSGLSALINPTAKASDFLKGFGINVKGIVEADKGNLKKTVLDFANSLNTLDPLNRARAIEMMFGKFQFARMSTLFKNITDQGSQASKVMGLAIQSPIQLAAMANKELEKVQSSPMYKFQKALADIQLKLVPIGESILKVITPIMTFVTKILDGFNHLNDGFKNFIVIGSAIGGIIAPALLMVVGLVANGAANILKFFTMIKNFFNRTTSASETLGETTNYLTQEQIKAEAVAASLDQTHRKLTQAFTSEAESIGMLTAAYEKSATAQRAFMFGNIVPGAKGKKFASGGIISGPGTGTSDSIVAMVSNGEAVIPAKSVARHPKLISALINGGIPGFANGYMYNPKEGSVETHLQEGQKLSGNTSPLIESLLGSRPQMASLSESIKNKIIVLGQLVADLPRSLNENLKRPTGVAITEFEKAWSGTDNKLFKAVSTGMAKMGMAFDPSNPKMASELKSLEDHILSNTQKLAARNSGIVTDAILSQATQSALKSNNGNVSKALLTQANSLREYRTTYSKPELMSAIANGELSLRSARTGGGRIVDPATGTQLGRLRSTASMSKQEQMAKYASLAGQEQINFLSQMGLRSDSKFVAASNKFVRNIEASVIKSVIKGLEEVGKIASPSKEAFKVGQFYGQGFLDGAKNSSTKATQAGSAFGQAAVDAINAKKTSFSNSLESAFVVSPSMKQHLKDSFSKILKPYYDAQGELKKVTIANIKVLKNQKTAIEELTTAEKLNTVASENDATAHISDAAANEFSATSAQTSTKAKSGRVVGKIAGGASAVAFAGSMLPGQIGQVFSTIATFSMALSSIDMVLGAFGKSIAGLAMAFPEVTIAVVALAGIIGGLVWLYNSQKDAQKKHEESIRALGNAAKFTATELKTIGTMTGSTLSKTPIQSLKSGMLSVVGSTSNKAAFQKDVQTLLNSKSFQTDKGIQKTIEALKTSKTGDARSILRGQYMALVGMGMDPATAAAYVSAMQAASGRNFGITQTNIGLGSKSGSAGQQRSVSEGTKRFGKEFSTGYKTSSRQLNPLEAQTYLSDPSKLQKNQKLIFDSLTRTYSLVTKSMTDSFSSSYRLITQNTANFVSGLGGQFTRGAISAKKFNEQFTGMSNNFKSLAKTNPAAAMSELHGVMLALNPALAAAAKGITDIDTNMLILKAATLGVADAIDLASIIAAGSATGATAEDKKRARQAAKRLAQETKNMQLDIAQSTKDANAQATASATGLTAAQDKQVKSLQKQVDALNAKKKALQDVNTELDRQQQFEQAQQQRYNDAKQAMISGDYLKAAMLKQESTYAKVQFDRQTKTIEYDKQIAILEQKIKDIQNGGKSSGTSAGTKTTTSPSGSDTKYPKGYVKDLQQVDPSSSGASGSKGTLHPKNVMGSINKTFSEKELEAYGVSKKQIYFSFDHTKWQKLSTSGDTVFAAPIKRYALGGLVSGIGTGTSDSILAKVSNGEYVMNANAVNRIGVSNLNKLNSGNSSSISNSDSVYNINMTINGGNANAKDIADMVIKKLETIGIKNNKTNRVGI